MTVHVLDLWIDGSFAGQLFRGQQDHVEFLYNETYASDPQATPLSYSMPLAVIAHGPEVVMPWLSNLLPDAEEVRSRWAAKFGERRTDPFSLLTHMGEDAPGSVQVVPTGVIPQDASEFSEITEAEIARRVTAILDDPDHWVDDSDGDESRFSLGGNQGKFALARIDGAWFEPNGRAASTHIVKPGMVLASGHTDGHVQAVEFVTMRAARAVGISAAKVDLVDFDGVHAFVTTRFDRHADAQGFTRRVHQEDFCQALSVYPSRKYEQDGGPTMADITSLVNTSVSPVYRSEDRRKLAELFVFNLLTAGVDAHAKNHGLLHRGRTTRLAPAYGLISAHGIWPPERVKFQSSAAVKYGKERPYSKITSRNLVRTADVLGVPREAFADSLMTMSDALPDAFHAEIAHVPASLVTPQLLAMPERIRDFAADIVDRIARRDFSPRNVPRFAGHIAIASPANGRVWEAGHWRGSSWQTGRYRSRA